MDLVRAAAFFLVAIVAVFITTQLDFKNTPDLPLWVYRYWRHPQGLDWTVAADRLRG
jgi:hypothetical protein